MIRRFFRITVYLAFAALLTGDVWFAWHALNPPPPVQAPLVATNIESVERAAIRLEPQPWTFIDTLATSAWAGLHIAAGLGYFITRRRV